MGPEWLVNQNFCFRKVCHTTLSLKGTVPGFQRRSGCPGRLTAYPREYQFYLFITSNSLLKFTFTSLYIYFITQIMELIKKLYKSNQTTQCPRFPCKNAVDSMLRGCVN